jgi:hypothetical protein
MEECEQGSKFYFRAINSFNRINVGDVVLIDTKSEIMPRSIVLTVPDYMLERAELVPKERLVGVAVCTFVKP